ncbi:hypothetical protein ACMFMG_005021 [Clarireedia jacksonii]
MGGHYPGKIIEMTGIPQWAFGWEVRGHISHQNVFYEPDIWIIPRMCVCCVNWTSADGRLNNPSKSTCYCLKPARTTSINLSSHGTHPTITARIGAIVHAATLINFLNSTIHAYHLNTLSYHLNTLAGLPPSLNREDSPPSPSLW